MSREPNYIVGFAYPRVLKVGEARSKYQADDVSQGIEGPRKYYDDPAIAINEYDFDPANFIGVPVHLEHKDIRVGVVTACTMTPDRKIEIHAKIEDGPTYKRVLAKDLKGFSIKYGFKWNKETRDVVSKSPPMEISLCRSPQWAECIVAASKGDNYSIGKSNVERNSEKRLYAEIILTETQVLQASSNQTQEKHNRLLTFNQMSEQTNQNAPDTQSDQTQQSEKSVSQTTPANDASQAQPTVNEQRVSDEQIMFQNTEKIANAYKQKAEEVAKLKTEMEQTMEQVRKQKELLQKYEAEEAKRQAKIREEKMRELLPVRDYHLKVLGKEDRKLPPAHDKVLTEIAVNPELKTFRQAAMQTVQAARKVEDLEKQNKELTMKLQKVSNRLGAMNSQVIASQFQDVLELTNSDARKSAPKKHPAHVAKSVVAASSGGTMSFDRVFDTPGVHSSGNGIGPAPPHLSEWDLLTAQPATQTGTVVANSSDMLSASPADVTQHEEEEVYQQQTVEAGAKSYQTETIHRQRTWGAADPAIVHKAQSIANGSSRLQGHFNLMRPRVTFGN